VYALDTNTVIHALKGIGRVRQRLQSAHPEDLVIPAVVMYELAFGTLKSRKSQQRQKDITGFLSFLTILPFDGRAADRAARVRLDLEQGGVQIGPFDTLIAGTVLAHGAVLITHNIGEFSRVPGLQIEDWY
jgi:tRNA(fMet)-specific endonuclease VapC